MAEAWIFRVEHEEGDLLYVAADPSPIEAERIWRDLANIPGGREVLLLRPDADNRFGLRPGEIRGPM